MKIRIEKTVATLLVFILYSSILMSANLIKISAVMGAQSDWPMFRHDLDHTGYTTSTGPTTNSYIWIHPIGNWVQSSPAVVNDVVYVGSSDGNVYALSTIDGSLVWSYPTGAAVLSCPAVADGVVYVGSGDFNVYALDAASGTKLWNYPTGGAVSSSPAVEGGVVFVSSFDGNVYALNAPSGTKLWNFSAGFEYSSPAFDGGVVYVGSTNGNVYALNAADGTKLWNYTTGSWVQSSPAVVNDVVYVGSQDGKVYALNAATGAFVWSYATDYIINSSPAVVNDVVYVGSEEYGPTPHKVYALSTIDGSLVWSYLTGDNVVSSPAVAGGIVYVGSDDGYVYALNAVTGDFVWSCETSGGQSSPAVSNGIVYVGANDGKIYAIGPSGPLASFAVDTLYEATPIAHQSFDIMVTAEDALYNVVTDYTGTVHFSSSDSLAVLPSDYTFTTSDNGVHTFPITFNTAGSQDLKVSDLASSVSNTPSWTVMGLTIINTVDIPPSSDWNYVIVADSSDLVDPGTVVESFTLPAGGGNMTFSDPVFTDGGIFNITAIPKFGYATDISTQQYDDYSYSVIGDFNATLNLHYKSAMTVTFTNAGMSAFATQYLGQAPPSDLNTQLPALKPIPVQSSWTVDISGNTIPDLVLGKPMAVLVSLAGVVLQSTDQVTVSVTFEGTQYSKSFSAVDLGISAIVGFSPIVPGKTATEDITGNYQVNSVNPIALTPTRVTVKTTNSLSLYFAYLSGSYGSVNQAAFDMMAQNSVAFLNATYPIKNVTANIVYSGKSITGSSKTGTSAMQADCVAVAAKAKSVMGAGAIGVAIGPNNTGLNNYFAALGKSGAAGVSFGPSTKGVVVLDGYYTAAAHEVAHTYGLYWGKPEQYQTNPPNGKASSGVWPTKSQWRTGYSFMGTAPYKTLDFSWVDDANTYRYLFNHTATNVADPEIVVVSGLIYKTGEVEFVSPWYHFNQGTPDTVPTGNYALKFLDANGGTLKITSFEADFFMHIDPGTGVGENQVDTSAYGMVPLDAASFVFAAEYPTGTAKIQVIDVTKPQTPLATVSAGNLVQVTHASGNSNIDLSGSNNMIIITGGNHFIDCRHATSTTILKIGKGNNIIILGGGNNVVKETAGGSDAITACDGSSDIDIAADGNYLIATSSGNDKIQITGNGGSIILAGNGDNVITISGDGNNAIATGSGKDLITVGNGNNIIFAGAGNDIITVGKGNNCVDGGAGYDVCVHGNGRNTIVNCEKK